MLGFMEPIGGKVKSFEIDIEASKKLSDISEVIKVVKETHQGIEYTAYIEGMLDGFEMIERIIKK